MCSHCTAIKMEYSEALHWLYSQKKLKKRENLNRIQRCIELLGIQMPYKIIHITGTNGKGSVASYLNTLFTLSGKKVGMFISPYVISFTERIQVSQNYISEEDVVSYIQFLKEFSESFYSQYQDVIPFFELTFLMALLHFQKQEIEILILECGLGGLLDATNVVHKDLTIITNIGYDHVKELGPTLEDIARHKLGITRENIPCITCVEKGLEPYFKEYAKAHNFPLFSVLPNVKNIEVLEDKTCFTYKGISYQTSLCGIFQAYNASLVIEAIQQKFPEVQDMLRHALLKTTWPGRFEKIRNNVILDGAHNLPGIEALVSSIKMAYPSHRIKVVFTALRDKAISLMLAHLDQISSYYYFTTIEDNRASEISNFGPLTSKPYQCLINYKEALTIATNSLEEKEVLVVTGSLHFISEARKYFEKEDEE